MKDEQQQDKQKKTPKKQNQEEAQKLVEKRSSNKSKDQSTRSWKFLKEPTDDPSGSPRSSRRGSRISHHRVKDIKAKEWFTIATLIYVNLVNYVDRYAVAGVLLDLQEDFKITKDKAGLLQTGFLLSYMVVAPIFGYLGDRYNRKYIIAFGVLLWNLCSLTASFMKDYWSFFALRSVVGVGEAGFSTIAPTIIGDIFSDKMRSNMLASFYLAMPLGCGLGYIVGSEMAKIGKSWHWGLRVTPAFGLLGVLLIIFLVRIPPRGSSEGNLDLPVAPWTDDIRYLTKNRSFVFATIATTCVFFVVGALAWWAPVFLNLGMQLQGNILKRVLESSTFMFGILTITAGIVGLALGCFLSQKLKKKFPKIDPFICSMGLLFSAPFIVGASYAATYSTILCFAALFIGEILLNFNCSVVNDIILYVTLPSRRSTAEGIYILFTHAFGDAGSPYLVGLLADTLYKYFESNAKSEWNGYRSLQYALFLLCVVDLIGAIFFFIVSLYLLDDKDAVDNSVGEIE